MIKSGQNKIDLICSNELRATRSIYRGTNKDLLEILQATTKENNIYKNILTYKDILIEVVKFWLEA